MQGAGVPGMKLTRERGGYSGWPPAGPLSGTRRSSVYQSLSWLFAPGPEPEKGERKKGFEIRSKLFLNRLQVCVCWGNYTQM